MPQKRVGKTVFQIAPYFPPHRGGVEKTVQMLSDSLAELGFEVKIFSSDKGSQNPGTANPRACLLWAVDLGGHTPLMPLLFPALLLEKTSRTKAVVHAHAGAAFVPEIAALFAKLRGLPFVLHLHGLHKPSGFLGFLLEPYQQTLFRLALHSADALIVQSESQAGEFSKKYGVGLEKFSVIPNGVVVPVGAKPRTRFGKRFLFVGRLSWQKNVSLLLEAFKLVLARHPSATLSIVGGGEELELLEKKAAALGFGGKVEFKGNVSDEALEGEYARADFFAISSRYEGFPLAVLEAMAHGLPVAAPRIPELESVVGKNALLAESDAESFASALCALVERRNVAAELSKKGLAFCRKNSWIAMARKCAVIYEKLWKARVS